MVESIHCISTSLIRCTPSYSLAFSLAFSPTFSSFKSSTRLQAKSPNGAICAAYSFALSLLACRSAHLAAMPCMMTLFRNTPNASPQGNSSCGIHCTTSAYHSIHWKRVGRPGVAADAANAKLILDSSSLFFGRWRANVNGESRFARSERGCPSVDISQLAAASAEELEPSNSSVVGLHGRLTLGYQSP